MPLCLPLCPPWLPWLDSAAVGCERASGTPVSPPPLTPSLLCRYGNHFILWSLNGTFWGPSCLQIQGEVASLLSCFLCCRFQSSNLRSYGASLEMRRRRLGVPVFYLPSWCPPDGLSPCTTVSYRQGVPGGPASSGGPSGLDLPRISVVFLFSVYFLKDPVLCQYLCSPPLHTPCSNDIKTPTLYLNTLMS